MTLISKEKVIEQMEEFADEMTAVGGAYVRRAVDIVIRPMEEAEEEDDLK